jgi:hypothetical protein
MLSLVKMGGVIIIIIIVLLQPTNAYIYIYHNSIPLYNVHCYMFRHLDDILREFHICVPLSYIIS